MVQEVLKGSRVHQDQLVHREHKVIKEILVQQVHKVPQDLVAQVHKVLLELKEILEVEDLLVHKVLLDQLFMQFLKVVLLSGLVQRTQFPLDGHYVMDQTELQIYLVNL